MKKLLNLKKLIYIHIFQLINNNKNNNTQHLVNKSRSINVFIIKGN